MKQNKNTQISKTFSPILRKISISAWVLRLIPIPIDILTASLTAAVVKHATDGNVKATLTASLTLIGVILAMRMFQTITGIAYNKASSKALHRCKMCLYDIFLKNPLSTLYRSGHGETIERLNEDFNSLTSRHTTLYPGFVCGLLTAAAYFAFLAYQSLPIAFVLAAISVLQLFPPLIVKRYMQANYDAMREFDSEDTDRILEAYYAFSTIKLYNLKHWWLERMKRFHKRYLKCAYRVEATGAAEDIMDNLLSNLLRYGAYGFIGLFVLYNLASMETGVEAIALSGGLFGAVKGIFDSIPRFAVTKTAEARVAMWFKENETATPTGTVYDSTITVDRVTLSFADDDRPLLRQASATIDTTKINLIHGANGAGKSTLMRAVIGLIPPKEGSVRLLGQKPDEIFESAAAPVFYLPQEDAVFAFSPRSLYSMARCNIEQACDIAHQFGLTDELLDQNIDTLSGGERKKTFLSLAFALNPSVLLLDEPTNSLDDTSRRLLCRLLTKRAKEGRGAVIITHDKLFTGELLTNEWLIHELPTPASPEIYIVKEGAILHE